MFQDQRICDFFTKRDQPYDYLNNVYTIHLTDQKLYNKFEYEMRAQIGITEPASAKEVASNSMDESNDTRNFQASMIKNMLYIGDFMSKLKIKYQVMKATKDRRFRIYERMKRTNKKANWISLLCDKTTLQDLI